MINLDYPTYDNLMVAVEDLLKTRMKERGILRNHIPSEVARYFLENGISNSFLDLTEIADIVSDLMARTDRITHNNKAKMNEASINSRVAAAKYKDLDRIEAEKVTLETEIQLNAESE